MNERSCPTHSFHSLYHIIQVTLALHESGNGVNAGLTQFSMMIMHHVLANANSLMQLSLNIMQFDVIVMRLCDCDARM